MSQRDRTIGLALLALGLVVGVRFSWASRLIELDDALIYQRVLRNALAGHGLVFNVGEAVNVVTSPLYALLSLGAAALFGVREGMLVVSVGCLLAALVVFYRLIEQQSSAIYGGASALTLASGSFFYRTLGMETTLFMLLIGSTLLANVQNRPLRTQLFIASLLVLARSEGVFLAMLTCGVALLRTRRDLAAATALRALIAPAGLAGAAAWFNWRAYGALLPHSGHAKIEQGRSGFWGEWPLFLRIDYQLDWFFGGSAGLVVLTVGLACAGVWRLRKGAMTWMIGGFLALLTGFYLVLNVPSYHWYYGPLYLFVGAFGGVGAAGVFSRGAALRRAAEVLPWRGRGVEHWARVAAGFAVAVCLGWQWVVTERTLRSASVPSPYRALGEWIAENSGPQASVAAAEVGILGWYSDRPIIDIVGLVTPANAALLAQGDVHGWLRTSDPQFVVIHDPPWPLERGAVRARRDGQLAVETSLEVPGFELLRRVEAPALPLSEQLDRLTASPPDARSEFARSVLGGAIRSRPLAAGPLLVRAVNLRRDGWTRGRSPAGLVVRNPTQQQAAFAIRLECAAPAELLPFEVTVESSRQRLVRRFEAAGSMLVELGSLRAGEDEVFVVRSGQAWRPGRGDARSLGVRVQPAFE